MGYRKNIIWLASYPKSGNTWLRVFLENIQANQDTPVNINDLTLTKIASSRTLFDRFSGVSSSDLTKDEIDRFRPNVYKQISNEFTGDTFLKVHDAWRLNSNSEELFCSEITKAVIYIIRHPLDVLVSNAYHNSTDFNKSAQRMNTSHILCDKKDCLYSQLEQQLFSWSEHVMSWIDRSKLPVITVKYEDLINKPYPTFSDILHFIEWNYSKEKIHKAIEFSKIGVLQEQEIDDGFREKPLGAKSFFRSGKIGSWKDLLDKDQINLMYEYNKNVMNRFGYTVDNQIPY